MKPPAEVFTPDMPPKESGSTDTRTDDEADVEEGADRKADPEWLLVGQILRILRRMDPKLRPHVLAYLAARFEPEVGT